MGLCFSKFKRKRAKNNSQKKSVSPKPSTSSPPPLAPPSQVDKSKDAVASPRGTSVHESVDKNSTTSTSGLKDGPSGSAQSETPVIVKREIPTMLPMASAGVVETAHVETEIEEPRTSSVKISESVLHPIPDIPGMVQEPMTVPEKPTAGEPIVTSREKVNALATSQEELKKKAHHIAQAIKQSSTPLSSQQLANNTPLPVSSDLPSSGPDMVQLLQSQLQKQVTASSEQYISSTPLPNQVLDEPGTLHLSLGHTPVGPSKVERTDYAKKLQPNMELLATSLQEAMLKPLPDSQDVASSQSTHLETSKSTNAVPAPLEPTEPHVSSMEASIFSRESHLKKLENIISQQAKFTSSNIGISGSPTNYRSIDHISKSSMSNTFSESIVESAFPVGASLEALSQSTPRQGDATNEHTNTSPSQQKDASTVSEVNGNVSHSAELKQKEHSVAQLTQKKSIENVNSSALRLLENKVEEAVSASSIGSVKSGTASSTTQLVEAKLNEVMAASLTLMETKRNEINSKELLNGSQRKMKSLESVEENVESSMVQPAEAKVLSTDHVNESKTMESRMTESGLTQSKNLETEEILESSLGKKTSVMSKKSSTKSKSSLNSAGKSKSTLMDSFLNKFKSPKQSQTKLEDSNLSHSSEQKEDVIKPPPPHSTQEQEKESNVVTTPVDTSNPKEVIETMVVELVESRNGSKQLISDLSSSFSPSGASPHTHVTEKAKKDDEQVVPSSLVSQSTESSVPLTNAVSKKLPTSNTSSRIQSLEKVAPEVPSSLVPQSTESSASLVNAVSTKLPTSNTSSRIQSLEKVEPEVPSSLVPQSTESSASLANAVSTKLPTSNTSSRIQSLEKVEVSSSTSSSASRSPSLSRITKASSHTSVQPVHVSPKTSSTNLKVGTSEPQISVDKFTAKGGQVSKISPPTSASSPVSQSTPILEASSVSRESINSGQRKGSKGSTQSSRQGSPRKSKGSKRSAQKRRNK